MRRHLSGIAEQNVLGKRKKEDCEKKDGMPDTIPVFMCQSLVSIDRLNWCWDDRWEKAGVRSSLISSSSRETRGWLSPRKFVRQRHECCSMSYHELFQESRKVFKLQRRNQEHILRREAFNTLILFAEGFLQREQKPSNTPKRRLISFCERTTGDRQEGYNIPRRERTKERRPRRRAS